MRGPTAALERSRAPALLLLTILATTAGCRPTADGEVLPITFRYSGAPILMAGVDLPEGRFSLLMPSGVTAGDSFSARATVTRHGPPGEGLVLGDHSVVVGGATFSLSSPDVRVQIDDDATELTVQLLDGKGRLSAEGSISIPRRHSDPTGPLGFATLPAYCSASGLLVFNGSFDGDADTTTIEIAGEQLEVWTESARQITAVGMGLPAGATTARVSERGVESIGSINVLSVEIEPRQGEAEAGESVPYLVIVDGLDGLSPTASPLLSVSCWTDGESGNTLNRDQVIDPARAIDGRVIVRGVFTPAESGTYHVSGGIRASAP